MSGLKAQLLSWIGTIFFSQFCHCGNVLMECFLEQVLATRLRDSGQYFGCHGHSEGNSPVSRRWMQWQKQDATAIVSTPHSRIEEEGGVKGKPAGMHNTLLSSNERIKGSKNFSPVILTLLLSSRQVVHFFARERFFPAVAEQIRCSTGRFHTLGRVPLTHCFSAVNSRSVLWVSAVFGPILELTQEIGPFWQPLPAGTAHSSPGTFCFRHMPARTCVYTLAKKIRKKSDKQTQSGFFFFFLVFLSH